VSRARVICKLLRYAASTDPLRSLHDPRCRQRDGQLCEPRLAFRLLSRGSP